MLDVKTVDGYTGFHIGGRGSLGKEWKEARKLHAQSPDVIIGKKGVTKSLLREIDLRLKNKGMVKVKILRSGLEVERTNRKELAHRVADALGARVLGIRGRTFVLYREGEHLNREQGADRGRE